MFRTSRRQFLRATTGVTLSPFFLSGLQSANADATNVPSVLKSCGLNDLSKPFSQNIHLTDMVIAGTTHVDGIAKLEPFLTQGMRLPFFREDNIHDSLAIMVKDGNGNKLGYVPRQQNEILARLMDAGKSLYGVVQSKEFVNKWLKITVQVYLND